MVVNIRDTIDELGCLKRLFEVQSDVVRKADELFREAERTHRGGEKSAVRLVEVAGKVGEFEVVVDKLIEAAKGTQESVSWAFVVMLLSFPPLFFPYPPPSRSSIHGRVSNVPTHETASKPPRP
jgi:hypothetical protein